MTVTSSFPAHYLFHLPIKLNGSSYSWPLLRRADSEGEGAVIGERREEEEEEEEEEEGRGV